MGRSRGLGIDFGTATTIVALPGEGPPKLFVDPAASVVMDPDDPHVIPSFVSFHPKGNVVAGRVAKARRGLDPVNTVFSFKRIIGLKWSHSEVKEFRKWYHADLEAGADDLPRFVTRAGPLSAVDVATHLFAYLREQAAIAEAPGDVVITVPPTFKAEQGPAIVAAAERAGFTQVRLLSEAYAASLPYLDDATDEQIVVVYDLGGGTFDLAALRCRTDAHEILAHGGDAYLGGDDIDVRLADWVVSEVLAAHHWDLRTDPGQYKKLIWACEQAKVRLSAVEETELLLTQVDPVLAGKAITIQRDYLEKLLLDLVQRTFVVCDEVLGAAGLTSAGVDRVILAGGGSFIPYVQMAVERYFGKKPHVDVAPDKLVAIGASIAAGTGAGA